MKAWIPRNLRDDGMISMNEAPSYASFVQQYVLLSDHEQALAEKDLALAQANRHKEELFQKLAEKDREIAALRGDLEKHVAIALDLQEYRQKYQQLMEQAVRFANYIKDEFTYDDDPRFIEADEFLQFPRSPGIEGGQAMTRKEELAESVRRIVNALELISQEQAAPYLLEELLQVEREVWEKVIAGYLRYKESLVPRPGCEKFPTVLLMSFEEWCRTQQQELGS